MFIETPASKKSFSFRKPVFDVGVIDVPYTLHTNQGTCPYYIRWRNMLSRCYSKTDSPRDRSYKKCTVDDRWLKLSEFKNWMVNEKWVGRHLDKDILKPGNLEYSPDTCIFLPSELNMLLGKSSYNHGTLPLGVCLSKNRRHRKYHAQITKEGKTCTIGRFLTPEDASEAYLIEKRKYLIQVSDNYINEPKIYKALIGYIDSVYKDVVLKAKESH